MRMLPSLLKNSVIKKQIRFTYQNSRMPEPFALAARPSAAHTKKPKLSSTTAITIVAIIVIAAPLTVALICPKSANVTLPLMMTSKAPIEEGMASFNSLGLHKMRTTVITNAKIVMVVAADPYMNY